MDVQTPLICAGVVAVSAAVVYLTSILGIRERTYEEAIEEQRRKSNLEINVKPSKTDKPKKDKKEKLNKKLNKKSKDKSSEGVSHNSEPKAQLKENYSHESVSSRKTEHVGFKPEPEIVLLDECEQNVDIGRHAKTSYDKPIKPILTNKNEQYIDQNQFDLTHGSGQRNSFDQIHPKDEFELLKESKKSFDKESVEVIETFAKTSYEDIMASTQTNSVELDSTEVFDSEVKHEILKNENHENSSPVRRSKKTKQNQIEGNIKDVSAKTIIDLVKSATLSNEEIQLLTDTLLNKQSGGSTEWRKKNDPLAVLKKQLQEKEIALEAEMKNLQAAVQKTRELRLELDTEKSKQINSREKTQQMQQEVQTLHMKLQQNYENHRSEMKANQTQVQQLQAKVSEERTHALRLQEENSRLQQLMKNEQHLKHEIEQLRNDRQQYEMRIASTQKTNDELLRKTQQYDNHIKTLTDSRQKDELSYQKHLNDVKQELQKCETQRKALVEELNHTGNKFNTFEAESIQLRKRFEETENSKNDEIKRLTNQLSELNKDKTILENALTEAKLQPQNGDVKDDNEAKLNKLNEELNATKEELNNLKNALENQIGNNEELKEKNRRALESIEEFEKVKTECVNSALKVSEEAFNKLKSESEAIKQENNTLNSKLAEAVDVKNLHVQEIELLKEALQEIFPSLDTKSDNWVSSIESTFNALISQRPIQSSNDEQTLQRVHEFESLLETERRKTSELEVKVSQYTTTLSETESILSNLQNKIETEEVNRKVREQEYQNELNILSTENNKLHEENKNLETNLSQIQGLRETMVEMEHNLKELRLKLQSEENEKKQWQSKYDEATEDASGLREAMNERSKEIELLESNKSEIDKMRAECEELKQSLEKEKKVSKELSTQNVRLNSLVRIGHESLKMEEDKVKQLEAQLNLNNGSVSLPVNCSAANGSPETVPLNSNLISDSTEEAASVKK